ncbi:hypothetical protein K474DRAFT_1666391 [Panus rudis PR-1116 ss-1]|nr:hypothetical protein K474DRAFT_1666391 [Panus rudis PR-1116 ss-1]
MSRYAHLSQADEELAPILAQLPQAQPMTDFIVAREQFNAHHLPHLQGLFKDDLPPETEYSVKDHSVPVEGGEITVRVLIPRNGQGKTAFPLMLWMHPGGFVLGGLDQDDYYLRRLCVDFQIVVVNVDYRLAPEHTFPTPLNDSYSALKWAVDNATAISANPKLGLILAGCSAGGNFAASLSIKARDDVFFKDRGIQVTGQLLQIPATLHPDAHVPQFKDELFSLEQFRNAPVLNTENVTSLARVYGAPPDHPEFSVVLAPSHKDLPPMYIQVNGADPLRDEGLLYDKILRENGVKTKLDVYPGLPHGGHLHFFTSSVAKRFLADTRAGLQWLLAGAKA